MKVAIDVAQTCVERAGCASHADALANALAARLGPENVVLYHHFGEWINAATTTGTKIDGVACPFADMDSQTARTLWAAIERGDQPLPGHPDVVHSNSFMAPQIPGAKLVYTIHDLCFWTHPHFSSETNRLLCQRQLLRSLSRAAGFVFVSERSRRDFETIMPGWLERKGKPWRTITSGSTRPSAPGRDAASRYGDPKAPWVHIGSIEPRKGIDRLLDAYQRYSETSCSLRPLLLAGSRGWLSERLHQRIIDAAKNLPIRYVGHLPDEELTALYRNAFGLICASYYEGFGLPVAEAAACGVPVISSDVPSLAPLRRSIRFYRDMEFGNAVEKMLELESDLRFYSYICGETSKIGMERGFDVVAQELIEFYVELTGYSAAPNATSRPA